MLNLFAQGAGKSSLTLALFRYLEAEVGKIRIDGIDISTIDLKRLRGAMNIVSQDAVILRGTIRDNIDIAGLYDDQDIWRVLHAVGLTDNGQSAGRLKALEDEIEENGNNLSAGLESLSRHLRL